MPPPGPEEIQVQTHFSTVSGGTEAWILRNRFTWAPTLYPCVPGYQRAGKIIAIGSAVRKDWSVGDRVMVTVSAWSGPVAAQSGAHLRIGNTPALQVFPIPEGVATSDASADVVAQVGVNAASRVQAPEGSWVAVACDGLIGQFAAQAARARGFRAVLCGHRADRLEAGLRYSADAIANSTEAPLDVSIPRVTGNESVAAVIDTVQGEAVQLEYMPLLESGRGQIVYSGFSPENTWADMAILQQRQLTVHFVSGWNAKRMLQTLEMMEEGKIQVAPLISHNVSYRQASEMYRMIREKAPPFLGITFDWN